MNETLLKAGIVGLTTTLGLALVFAVPALTALGIGLTASVISVIVDKVME